MKQKEKEIIKKAQNEREKKRTEGDLPKAP